MINNRISSARAFLSSSGADFLLISNLANIRYLSGFTGSSGLLVLGAHKGWFLTDSRYTSQASVEITGFEIIECVNRVERVASLLQDSFAKVLGFEASSLTVTMFNEFSAALPAVELRPVGLDFGLLRARKDAGELDTMEICSALASAAFMDCIDKIRPGMRERDIALALEFRMREAGAESRAFDFIVASGERGALPHGRASDKLIEAGNLVTVDFGAVYDGYFSDETATVAVGKPDGRQQEIYGIVKTAHDRAMAAVRPGVQFKELDAIARGYIDQKGYGAFFGHGLGHGVGLEVHEPPTVSFRGEGTVEEGMVFTIEPGIYIPGWGGVRIEDTVYVTGDGCRCLTRVPKDLMVL